MRLQVATNYAHRYLRILCDVYVGVSMGMGTVYVCRYV